ncbi:MAG: hypothetical protein OEZ01_10760 [Candidatus Heimdallarchaeota archaeon]|nr:hypothetical protein [Candidatus Heimdallarchaeota archaeon]MDH5646482.1 hypothetical protein [Candidatus Heimdallarchaeota archaeon]
MLNDISQIEDETNLLNEMFNDLGEKEQRVIIFLFEWNRPIRVGDMKNYLKYPHSTLNSVLKRLVKLELVIWENYKQVYLKQIARRMVAHHLQHHKILEIYFLQELNITSDQAHDESIRVAGVLSCNTILKMKEKITTDRLEQCGIILNNQMD